MSEHKLTVKLYGCPVGMLIRDPKGRHQYVVENATSIPLSLSFPKVKSEEEKRFVFEQCEPYFAGLLPDNPALLSQLSVCLKMQSSDTFGLLSIMGTDCAGAVQFEAGFSVYSHQEPRVDESENRTVSLEDLAQQVKVLDKRPFFLGMTSAPALLSGHQYKVGIRFENNQIILPGRSYFSTHILKPVFNNQELIQNEWFCMILAKKLGLSVAKVELRSLGSIIALLIERYDRVSEQGVVKAIHQEDFCQALGLLPHQKYQRNKGISLADCFDLLSKTEVPARARIQFMDAIIFNYLIGNTNYHGKKMSLLRYENGVVALAPLYGLQCGSCSHQSSKMAMKIGTQYDIDAVTYEDWQILCRKTDYAFPALRKRMLELSQQIITLIPHIKEECQDAVLEETLIENLVNQLMLRCEQTMKQFLLS